MDPLGKLQGKLGSRVYLRSRTGKRVYDRMWIRGPERRTEPQLRAMRALSSGTRAWRRLTQAERDRWRDEPPIKTLRHRNRDAASQYATGWNWFIGAYIVDAASMIFASASTNDGSIPNPNVEVTALRLKLPANHPRNLAIRAGFAAKLAAAGNPVTASLSIVGTTPTGVELWRETDELVIQSVRTNSWGSGFKYFSSGDAQRLELRYKVNIAGMSTATSTLEIMY